MDNNRVTKDTRLFEDACHIIEQSRDAAYRSVNIALLRRNWELGRRIDEEILNGENRAEYGAGIIKELSKELTNRYGKGFTKSNLYSFLRFSRFFPQIFQSKIGKSQELLHWTHYSLLINIDDADAREWYAHEAFAENWKVSTLRRNIASQYYYRLLQSQDKDGVKREMLSITSNQNPDKLEFIKNPVIAEFLGLSSNNDFYESELESCIITHLESYLTYLPTEEELRNEIEHQKEVFMLQRKGGGE